MSSAGVSGRAGDVVSAEEALVGMLILLTERA